GGEFKILNGGEFSGGCVQQRIDVKLEIVLKQPSERFQNASLQLRVVLLVEQFAQTGDAHRDPDFLFGVSRQVRGQAVVLEVIRDQHRHPLGGQQIDASQEIAVVQFAGFQQVVHGDFHELHDLFVFHAGLMGKLFVGT